MTKKAAKKAKAAKPRKRTVKAKAAPTPEPVVEAPPEPPVMLVREQPLSVPAQSLYAAIRALPITDDRLRKAKRRFPAVYYEAIERLRLEGWITRAQAAL